MTQATIARILAIEAEASRIHEDARAQAAIMLAAANKETSALREQTLADARRQAEQLVSDGRQAAEAERARIIAQAEAEASEIEALASDRLGAAVRFVLAQVSGRE